MDMVCVLLNQLTVLVADEASLLGRLEEDVQQIIDELGHMKAFLMLAEGKEDEDPQLKEWISQVRDLAYTIQDVLDVYMLRICNHRGRARRFFISMKNLHARHQIGKDIRGIISRMKHVSESFRRYQTVYNLHSLVSPITWHGYIDEALLVEEAKLVGIDHPKEHLISQLIGGDSDLKVIAVLGMGGLGKTTLAKKVTEDADVRRHFHILVWVTVSQTCDMLELFKGLIQQLYREIQKPVPQEMAATASTDQMKLAVRELLQNKRYLIVFDDVWDRKFWDAVKLALPEGSCSNRVMLTTRINHAARACSAECRSYIYEMKPLSYEDSWNLLCRKTFQDNCCPSHLEDVLGAILRKCNGLPLAIVVTGGILALKDKTRIDEWKMVERSFGGELEANGRLETITQILSLSYNYLPYHLKPCLLYLSVFPEDYLVDERRLLRLWIAEGFIQEMQGMTRWEIGRLYLSELTNRSLIQVTNPNDPFYRMYHMHDLLREVVLTKSRRQNFASIATGEQMRWPEKVRRLSVHNYRFDIMENISFRYLRSLLMFKSNEPFPASLSKLLSRGCKLLKVLDVQDAQLEEIPKEVFRFFHLKVLNLCGSGVKVVPKAISNLKNLEFLDLRFTKVRKLPKEVIQLRRLVHLTAYSEAHGHVNGPVIGFELRKNIAKLLSLEILLYIEANELLIKNIGELKKLKSLGITCLRREDGKQFCCSLGQLSNLRKLYIQAITDDEEIDLDDMNISLYPSLQNLQRLGLFGRLERIPNLVPLLEGLVSVSFIRSRLMNDPLESLQYLPNLQRLDIDHGFLGESLCFRNGCFLNLETLSLLRLDNLRWLIVEEGAMPKLLKLALESFVLLEEFPWGVKHLRKLQHLYLRYMSDKVTAQLENLDKDYDKISHISRISIWDEDRGEWYRYPQDWKARTSPLEMA